MSPKSRLTAKERRGFREILLKRREEILGQVNHLEEASMSGSQKSSAGAASAVPTHMADAASDNYDLEVTCGLIETEREELRLIDAALKRIEDKTYGVCEKCEKPIPKSRLRVVPFARLCIQCKEEQEQGRTRG